MVSRWLTGFEFEYETYAEGPEGNEVDTIAVMNADGSGLHEVTTPASLPYVGYPAWSPDRLRVASLRYLPRACDECPATSEVHVVDAAGGNERVVAYLGEDIGWGAMNLDWSPDGSKLAFNVEQAFFPAPPTDSLYTLTLDGALALVSTAANVTAREGELWSRPTVSWSPDGKLLASVAGVQDDPVLPWCGRHAGVRAHADGRRARSLSCSPPTARAYGLGLRQPGPEDPGQLRNLARAPAGRRARLRRRRARRAALRMAGRPERLRHPAGAPAGDLPPRLPRLQDRLRSSHVVADGVPVREPGPTRHAPGIQPAEGTIPTPAARRRRRSCARSSARISTARRWTG